MLGVESFPLRCSDQRPGFTPQMLGVQLSVWDSELCLAAFRLIRTGSEAWRGVRLCSPGPAWGNTVILWPNVRPIHIMLMCQVD